MIVVQHSHFQFILLRFSPLIKFLFSWKIRSRCNCIVLQHFIHKFNLRRMPYFDRFFSEFSYFFDLVVFLKFFKFFLSEKFKWIALKEILRYCSWTQSILRNTLRLMLLLLRYYLWLWIGWIIFVIQFHNWFV